MKKQPLLVHIVFHPASESARTIARHLHRQLNGDIMVPGLRVPTRFCPASKGQPPPAALETGSAERNFVVVLADDELTIDDAWCDFVWQLWDQARGSVRFLPIQMTSNAWPLDQRLNGVAFAKAYLQAEGGPRDAFAVRRVVVELCRWLSNKRVEDDRSKAPLTLFLSHAKADMAAEPRVTQQFFTALLQDQPIEAWVDSGDIDTGSKFADAIEAGVESASLLSILTDNYAAREWCREEIFLAKEKQRPVVVVDAMNTFEVRSFPYLGNVPRLRWDGDPQKGIDLLLKETLRHLHAEAVLEQSIEQDDKVFLRAPELATLLPLKAGDSVLYPDPPVGIGEARRLAQTQVKFVTPLERLATKRPLAGKAIALSMSESTDLAARGWDPLHLESGMLDVSRYLLIMGARLTYGGHLGEKGYTQKLFELVRSYNDRGQSQPAERIRNIRGWPLPPLSVKERAELNPVATTVQLGRPDGIDESLHPDFKENPARFTADESALHRFAWARGMSEMRAYQADVSRSGIVARIVLGGTYGPTIKTLENGATKEQWYGSRIPGVLEEVVLSVQKGQPVFLIGAFGGIARLIIDLLLNPDNPPPAPFTWEYQKHVPFAPELKAIYEQKGIPWLDYPEIVDLLRAKGIEGINPLLTKEQHMELFQTIDPARMIELILEGVGKIG